MTTTELEVLTATPVPFSDDGSLLMATYVAMLGRIALHTEGVFVNGTTGEFPALEDQERSELLESAVDVFGADKVVAHIGAPSARQVLRHAEAAANLGVTRLAALTPYYLPCDFAQVHDLFTTVTQAFPQAAVFVYLFPERSGIDVSPEELAELTVIDGVAGAKLSGRPNDRFERYVELAAPGSLVYSGDDGSYPRVAAAGGAGVVSGVSAAFPELFGRLTEVLTSPTPDPSAVEAAQAPVTPAVHAAGPTVTRLKYALSARYGETWGNRMALPAVSQDVRAEIDAAVRAMHTGGA